MKLFVRMGQFGLPIWPLYSFSIDVCDYHLGVVRAGLIYVFLKDGVLLFIDILVVRKTLLC